MHSLKSVFAIAIGLSLARTGLALKCPEDQIFACCVEYVLNGTPGEAGTDCKQGPM